MTSQKLNQRQTRQVLYLSQFDFTFKYIPEKSIGKANELSRRLDQQERVKNNNQDQMLIKPEWIKRMEILVEKNNLRKKIKKAQKKHKKVVKVVEKLKKTRMKTLRDEK